ncbi:hypothetical protein BOTBODRAFT_39028 [Botryobasidium botryosum FD-172 SS1]|uniref:Peptidase A1 domain-containing protein n=1 Tax=Botryobasidium botryosum (strain FD-172 SS1) TaxID=930990 RepID=A0A067M5N7_BOTB1|nr:hypothetical protein BOTBODRAFT_39028 [Botryobasidium botryosum FD-172 SS1]
MSSLRKLRTYAALGCLLLAASPPALARRIKRDDSAPWSGQVPKIVSLTGVGDSQFAAQVNMGVDSAAQSFNLTLSSTIAYTVVAGTNCSSCVTDNANLYNPAKSTTYQTYGSGITNVSLGTGAVAGDSAKEACGLKTSNGTFWNYANQTIIIATGSDSAATPTPFTGGSGIVGLGLTGVPNLADSLLGQQFMLHPNRSTVNVGFALGSDSAQGSNAGQMHVLAPDPNSYQGDISLVNVASVNAGQKPPNLASADWAVPVTQWVFSNGGGGSANSPAAFVAIPEISLPSIYVPATAAPTIYALIANSTQSGVDGNSTVWSVPCSSKFSFSATIGGVSFTATEKDLVLNNGTGCVSAIRSWADPSMGTYIFGSKFLQNAYIVFSASSSGMAASQVGWATRASGGSSNHTGAIVGGVIGGLAGLALLIGGIFMFMRWRKRDRTAPSQKAMTDDRSSWYPASTTVGSPAPHGGYSGLPQTPGTAFSDFSTSPQPGFQPLAPVHMEVERSPGRPA